MSNRWFVITGAPCSGKSTLTEALALKGHRVMPEAARSYIDGELAKGRTLADIRRDQVFFQKQTLRLKAERELALPRNETVFFDRGIPDTRAYHRHLGIISDEELDVAIAQCSYRRVFLLHPLPIIADYARTETPEEQQALHTQLKLVYQELGFPITEVPVDSVEVRLQILLREARQ